MESEYHFVASLRFELFYALQVMTDRDSRIHKTWKERALANLSKEFGKKGSIAGAAPMFWANFSDVLQTAPIELSFDRILVEIGSVPIDEFQTRILKGLIHNDRIAQSIVAGKVSLQDGLAKVPRTKREWLAFAGLFPYDRDHPEIKTLELLLHEPIRFRKLLLEQISVFWEKSFKNTWNYLQPQYERSIGEKERLFHSCSFSEFAKQALLRIEIDETRQVIKALRGGAEDPMARIRSYYFIPSAFNDKRLWTACDEDAFSTAYFPYFDPTLTLDFDRSSKNLGLIEAELDPALIFRVLGDTTRYAIVTLLARTPRTSVELTKLLSISKSTISQHVGLLRQAGLVDEHYFEGSVKISLRRKVLEHLSTLVIEQLYSGVEPITLTTTRSKT